ncbi:hypothetical protein FA95DRAFT_1501905, partial [Auriscalpium vulgare]
VLDRKQRVIVKVQAQPRGDATWPEVPQSVNLAMKNVATDLGFERERYVHGRGEYPTLTTGYSFGGGPTTPHNIGPKIPEHAQAVQRLCRHTGVLRYTGYTNGNVSSSAPRLYRHLADALGQVRAHDPSLQPPFDNSVFTTATFNFGPKALTVPHRDTRNVPYGWCAITALGEFDPTKGGHLVLWELKLVIEFPPGSTILIPSAIITHSNTPIQDGEFRQSFTQYVSGSLIRWAAYGCRTEEDMRNEDPLLAAKIDSERATRWETALRYFSKWEELADDLHTL